jgi:hypothetical protein
MVCLFFASRLESRLVAVLLFCQCGSDRVEIKLWNVKRAQLHCLSCGQEACLDGFTISEFDPAKLIGAALVDQGRKHRRRPPDEQQRIVEPAPDRGASRVTPLIASGRDDSKPVLWRVWSGVHAVVRWRCHRGPRRFLALRAIDSGLVAKIVNPVVSHNPIELL